MKTLQDLKLGKKSHAKVEAWMKEWLIMLIVNADYREGNVYRADFESKDFFYFTDCRDIVSKETESTSDETNIKIRSRKRYIMNQLLVKAMLGELKLNKLKCSHCGCEDVYIDSIDGGYFKWCPKCLKTDIHVFPDAYNTCIASMQMRLRKKYLGGELEDIGSKIMEDAVANEKKKPILDKKVWDAEVKKKINPDPRLKDVVIKKRKNVHKKRDKKA